MTDKVRTVDDDVAWGEQVRKMALATIERREDNKRRKMQMRGPGKRPKSATLSQAEKDKIWKDVREYFQAKDRGDV